MPLDDAERYLDAFVEGFLTDPFNMIKGEGEYGRIFKIKEKALQAFDKVVTVNTGSASRDMNLEGGDEANFDRQKKLRRDIHVRRLIEATFREWFQEAITGNTRLGAQDARALAKSHPWVLAVYGVGENDKDVSSTLIRRVEEEPWVADDMTVSRRGLSAAQQRDAQGTGVPFYEVASHFLKHVVKLQKLSTVDLNNQDAVINALDTLTNAELDPLFASSWRYSSTKPNYERRLPQLTGAVATTSSAPETLWEQKAKMKEDLLRLIDSFITSN
jgi:hypothetical protein